ncbi:hypothetical protein JTB14_002524 [Gonioctena quinquepunctata]|nr:hypothetical protein JTB14_002524 [Gonioctena quinquepunctata]
MQSYADDTEIKYSFDIENIPVAVQRLHNDLEHLRNYYGKHALKLNHKKSSAMLFCVENVYEIDLKLFSILTKFSYHWLPRLRILDLYWVLTSS